MSEPKVNPTKVTVTEANVSAHVVERIALRVSRSPGGPYTVARAVVPIGHMKRDGDKYSVDWSALTFNPPLALGQTYFLVAESINGASNTADNAQFDRNTGAPLTAPPQASGRSPEVQFRLEVPAMPPAGPTGLDLE